MSFAAARSILGQVSKDYVIQGLQNGKLRSAAERILVATGRNNKRACPLKPVMVLWVVVAMTLYRNLSITKVFERLLRWTRATEPGLHRRPVTPEALCHARERLGVLPLKHMHRYIVSEMAVPVPATFYGLRLWAIDGSEFTVPDTDANVKTFGKHRNDRGEAAYPQMRAVFLTVLVTHQLYDACFMPCTSSERDATAYLVGRNLDARDLLLVDRGFASFTFFLQCRAAQTHFLARISAQWKPRKLRSLGPGDSLVELTPSDTARSKLRKADKYARLTLRLIEFRVGSGQLVRLITDLLEPTALKLAQEYHTRWECELTHKELKLELLAVTDGKQKTHFRSKKPLAIFQEAWGAVLAHTLVRELMAEAAEKAGVPLLELSFKDSVEAINLALPTLQVATRRSFAALRAALLCEIGCCRIDRPRRNRQFPRKVKRKMSNYQLKGATDKGKTINLEIHFLPTDAELSLLQQRIESRGGGER